MRVGAEDCSHLARGAVKDAVVLQDKGYGFVTFEDPKVAQTFLEVSFSC